MSGYIGNIPTPQATQTRETFTATASQTTFNTAGYTPGFVDVWLNGVKLVNGDDFTATNGSDVVLTVGAASGDTVEVLSFSTFEVNSQTFTGGLTVNNDGATVITADRATSDGSIVDFKKDGTTVGSIGAKDSNVFIGTGNTGVRFSSGTNSVFPIDTSVGNGRDAAIDLGLGAGGRFKDLYLSGGVYLGGTGAANKLDDYEEGTWTPSFVLGATSITYSGQFGKYIKIGDMVHCWFLVSGSWTATADDMRVGPLPFTRGTSNTWTSPGWVTGTGFSGPNGLTLVPSVANYVFAVKADNNGTIKLATSSSKYMEGSFSYSVY